MGQSPESRVLDFRLVLYLAGIEEEIRHGNAMTPDLNEMSPKSSFGVPSSVDTEDTYKKGETPFSQKPSGYTGDTIKKGSLKR